MSAIKCLGLTVLIAGAMTAAPLTWDVRSGSSTQSSNLGTGFGNTYTFNNLGITATITAWGLTGSSGTRFQPGQLGRWSFGMGVCNANEGANCGSPDHQVDNANGVDFVLIQFSSPILLSSVQIQPYGNYDTDVSYFTGNTAAGLNLNGKSIADLAALGFGAVSTDLANASTNARSVVINSSPVNALLFGARLPGGDPQCDYFKVQVISGSSVPEPATLGLVGLALLAAGLVRRRPKA